MIVSSKEPQLAPWPGLALRPFDEQCPFAETCLTPVRRSSYAHTGKARLQLLVRSVPPRDGAPSVLWQTGARRAARRCRREQWRGGCAVHRGNRSAHTGPSLWCVARQDLLAPAIAPVGLLPHRVIYVGAGDEPTVLTCFEETLRHGELSAVVEPSRRQKPSDRRRPIPRLVLPRTSLRTDPLIICGSHHQQAFDFILFLVEPRGVEPLTS